MRTWIGNPPFLTAIRSTSHTALLNHCARYSIIVFTRCGTYRLLGSTAQIPSGSASKFSSIDRTFFFARYGFAMKSGWRAMPIPRVAASVSAMPLLATMRPRTATCSDFLPSRYGQVLMVLSLA